MKPHRKSQNVVYVGDMLEYDGQPRPVVSLGVRNVMVLVSDETWHGHVLVPYPGDPT